MPLSLDEQIKALCDTILKVEKPTNELKERTVAYLQQYLHYAEPAIQAMAREALGKAFSVNPDELLGKSPAKDADALISKMLPQRGWLGDYLRYTERHEAPDLFHFWTGVSVLHAAIRRNIYFEHGYYRIFPNSYIILVAPPGICKKSTATNIGVEILQEVTDVTIIREKITPEALIQALSQTLKLTLKSGLNITPTATGFIHAPELAVFLGREKYNEGLIALLTSLFDCHNKWEYTTRGSGKVALHNLHLTLLGATTPDLMSQVIPEHALGGGLLSRVIFAVKERTPRCEPFPVMRDRLMKETLVAKLVDISQREGQCVQSPEAMDWCAEWYRGQHNKVQEEMALSGYYERKQSHLIKLAMTLLVSENEELIITPQIYERALKILEYTERTMPLAFERIQKTQIGQDHETILRHLERSGGSLKHSELLRKIYGRMDARRMASAIQTLREAGLVDQTSGTKGTAYILTKREKLQ